MRCDDPTLPTGSENLVVRAAERLKAETRCPLGATIELRKAIPAQAGLAGGSSDAAATLVALDRLWDLRLPPDRLDALAGEIGSDVAFFRHAPAAVCRGRGERVEPMRMTEVAPLRAGLSPDRPEHGRRLPKPDTARTAPAARTGSGGSGRGPTGRPRSKPVQPASTRRRASRSPPWCGCSDALASLGPSLDGHLMSGSGSAYFGLCPRPRRGGPRRATPRNARTRMGPGRDLRPSSRERLVKEYRLWRSPKSASSSWKTTRAATNGCKPFAASPSTTCSSSAT